MAAPSYLCTLVNDELRNVVRYLSARPNRVDWYNFLVKDDLRAVFAADNALTYAAASLFTSLTDGMYEHYDHCGVWPPCSCLSNTASPNAYTANFFPLVMQLCGSNITHVAFSKEQDLNLSSAMAIVSHGEKVNSLSLYNTFSLDEFETIMQHRGRQLRRLRVNCIRSAIAHSIANHCSALSELTLIDGSNNFSLVLNAVGRDLTSLEVKSRMSDTDFNLIQTNCPKLRRIRLWCVQDSYDSLVLLCRFYGKQLEFASIHQFSALQCRRVIEECANIRVEVDVISDVVDTLRILSKHAQNISISFQLPVDKAEIGYALASCTCLQRLHVHGMEEADDDVLLKLFNSFNCSSLQELSMQQNIEVRPNEISAIATATRELRILKLTIDCAELRPEALEIIIERNPHLERVKILLLNFDPVESSSEHGSDYDSQDDLLVPDANGEWFLHNLVRQFSAAKHLCELVVLPHRHLNSWWDYLYCVADACLAYGLRKRRLHVSVLNVDYLPAISEDVETEWSAAWQGSPWMEEENEVMDSDDSWVFMF